MEGLFDRTNDFGINETTQKFYPVLVPKFKAKFDCFWLFA